MVKNMLRSLFQVEIKNQVLDDFRCHSNFCCDDSDLVKQILEKVLGTEIRVTRIGQK